MVKSIHSEGSDSRFTSLCKGAHEEYSGADACAYNMARAFSDAKVFLEKNVSKHTSDWEWGKLHTITWKNDPLADTWLRRFYVKEVSVGGGMNTVSCAKFTQSVPDANKPILTGVHFPSYRQVL